MRPDGAWRVARKIPRRRSCVSRRRRPHLVCRAFYPSGVRPAPNSDSALIFVTDRRSRTCTVVDSTKCTPFLFLVRLYRAHGDVPRTTIDKLASISSPGNGRMRVHD